MDDKKLILTTKKYKADSTTVVSARVSTQLMKKIEDLAKRTNRTKNEMIQLLLAYAVDNAVVEDEN